VGGIAIERQWKGNVTKQKRGPRCFFGGNRADCPKKTPWFSFFKGTLTKETPKYKKMTPFKKIEYFFEKHKKIQ